MKIKQDVWEGFSHFDSSHEDLYRLSWKNKHRCVLNKEWPSNHLTNWPHHRWSFLVSEKSKRTDRFPLWATSQAPMSVVSGKCLRTPYQSTTWSPIPPSPPSPPPSIPPPSSFLYEHPHFFHCWRSCTVVKLGSTLFAFLNSTMIILY